MSPYNLLSSAVGKSGAAIFAWWLTSKISGTGFAACRWTPPSPNAYSGGKIQQVMHILF